MEKILQKKEVKRFVVGILVSFVFGILLDHFLIYPFFKISTTEVDSSIEQGNENIEEPLVLGSSTQLDRKIEIEKVCKTTVDISGALKHPGVFCLDEGARVIDAVTKAGGFSPDVAYRFVARKINLAQKLVDNQKIYIPFEDETECTLISFLPQTKEVQNIMTNSGKTDFPTSEDDTSSTAQTPPQAETDGSGCININSASASQLETISGIGSAMSKKIIEGRPYSKIEDLLNVSGIGDALFKKIKSEVCV